MQYPLPEPHIRYEGVLVLTPLIFTLEAANIAGDVSNASNTMYVTASISAPWRPHPHRIIPSAILHGIKGAAA